MGLRAEELKLKAEELNMAICAICHMPQKFITNTHLKYKHAINRKQYDKQALCLPPKFGLECGICHNKYLQLIKHIKSHNLNWQEYSILFPNSQSSHESVITQCKNNMIKRHNATGLCKICKSNNHTTETHGQHVSTSLKNNPKIITEEQRTIIGYNSHLMWQNPTSRAKLLAPKRLHAISEGNKRKWQDPIYIQKQKEAKERLFLRNSWHMKEVWANPTNKERMIKQLLKGSRVRPTSFEQTIIDISNNQHLPIKYVGNGELIIAGQNPDFILTNNTKGIIEVFHDYYKIKNHGSVKNYIKERTHKFPQEYSSLFIGSNLFRHKQDRALLTKELQNFIRQLEYNKEKGEENLSFVASL
jgi:hypothetical protein